MIWRKLFGHLIERVSSVSAADRLEGGISVHKGGFVASQNDMFSLKGSHRALPSDNTCYCLLMLIMYSRNGLRKEGRRRLTLGLLHIAKRKRRAIIPHRKRREKSAKTFSPISSETLVDSRIF